MLLCALPFVAACERVVKVASAEPAPWAYVKQAWGGLALGSPTIDERQVIIPFHTHLESPTHIDSAICIGAARARVEVTRLMIQLERVVCSSLDGVAPVIRFDRPAPGNYVAVYDDAGANFPELGVVAIP